MKKVNSSLLLVTLTSVGLLLAVLWPRQKTYVPKPKGYPRIVLPEHVYVPLSGDFPYLFEVSQHAVVTPDNSPRAEKYWLNIHYPAFEADIQLTYKPVKGQDRLLREYFDDAFKLTAKHQVKASAIQEHLVKTSQGHIAVVAELEGQVPSQMQFHTTDTTHHFLRGALYFNTATQNDYLSPIIDFIKQDILHLLHTLRWKAVAQSAESKSR